MRAATMPEGPKHRPPNSQYGISHKSTQWQDNAITGSAKSAKSFSSKLSQGGASQRTRTHKPNKRRRKRSWLFVALLPLLYLAFAILHLLFWLATDVPVKLTFAAQRRRGCRQVCKLEEMLYKVGVGRRKHADDHEKDSIISPAFKVPQHLALYIPSTPPSSATLVLDILCRQLSKMSKAAWESMAPSSHDERYQKSNSTQQSRWNDHYNDDKVHRWNCLQKILRYAALSGIPTISLWDDEGEQGGMMEFLKTQKGFDKQASVWKTTFDAFEQHSTFDWPHCRLSPLYVHVWDSTRRRSSSSMMDCNGCNHPSADGNNHLSIRLNILTPTSDGRGRFAQVSKSLAHSFLDNCDPSGEDTFNEEHKDRALPLCSSSQFPARQAAHRTDRLNVHDVEIALKNMKYMTEEPDFFLIVSPNYPTRTIGEFPRWNIRITEICHTRASAKAFTVLDFWLGLKQFTRAEHRYGR